MAILINGSFMKLSSVNLNAPSAVVMPPPIEVTPPPVVTPPAPAAPKMYLYSGGLSRSVSIASPGSTYGRSVAISGDASLIAVGSNGGGYVEVFQIVDGWPTRIQTLQETTPSYGRQVTLSGDGSTLFVGSNNSVTVYRNNAGTFELKQVCTVASPQYGTSIGVFPIQSTNDGNQFVANDGYQTHVYKYSLNTFSMVIYYSNFADTDTGSTKMSSDGSTFLMMQSGSVVALRSNGDLSNEITIGSTIESYCLSGDGLTATASGPAGSRIFERTSKDSPIWNQTARFDYFDTKGIGRCDSINENGTIFVTSSAGYAHARIYRKIAGVWESHAEQYESGGYGYVNVMAKNGSAFIVGAPTYNTKGGAFVQRGEVDPA